MKLNLQEESIIYLVLERPSETVPIWSTSNAKVGTIEVKDDYTCKILAVGPGKVDVVARTNCDFGSGVREHNTVFSFEVESEEVVEKQEDNVPEASPYWTEK